MSKQSGLGSLVLLLLTGVVATITATVLVLAAFPTLRQAINTEFVFDAYDVIIRKPLLKLVFGIESDLPWGGMGFDALALWLVLFSAINVFIYRNEGVLLWGHVQRNYCGRTKAVWWCTLVKTTAAFIATPYACARIFIASFQNAGTLFTCCYITLDPDVLARYLKYVGLAVGLIIGTLSLATRMPFASSP